MFSSLKKLDSVFSENIPCLNSNCKGKCGRFACIGIDPSSVNYFLNKAFRY